MRFLDLGPLEVEVTGAPVGPGGRALAALLEALLVHANQQVPVARLLDAVWGEETRPGSSSTLETHIWRLRRLLEPERRRGEPPMLLVNDSGGYRLLVSAGQVDSLRFAELSVEVVHHLATAQPERALDSAETALALWRGAPYPQLSERTWAAGPTARLHEIRIQLQERRIDALLATGHPDAAVSELETLVAEHPFRERLWWQRMLALYRTDRAEAALATYQLARRTLLDEVGVDQGPELVRLQRQILAHDPALQLRPRTPQARAFTVHVPRLRHRPIGRDQELAAVDRLLDRHRVVTLTGPAGCGKTTLAMVAARTSAQRYTDGVWFVDLVTATSSTDVAAEVARTIGVAVPHYSTPVDTLTRYGADRRVLLVLDNCEQVLNQCAELVDALVESGTGVSVLATSREPLCVEGEHVQPLGPLAQAAELFLDRAELSEHRLSVSDRRTVERICRSLDGIALAVELAAALTSTFSLAEIADQVERDPGGLGAVGRGHPSHHQGLTAAIDRSYRLMTEDERLTHRRLAVLPAEFSLRVARALIEGDTESPATNVLARLAHRSMLSVSRGHGSGTRFRQLATIRAHAQRELGFSGELRLAERRVDEWSHRLATSRPTLGCVEEAAWHAAVQADLPTIRSTLHRRLVVERDVIGLEVSVELSGFWYYANLMDEGYQWAELAASTPWPPEAGPPAHQLASISLSGWHAILGRSDDARAALLPVLADLESAHSVCTESHGAAIPPLSQRAQTTLRECLLFNAVALSIARDAHTMQRIVDLVSRGAVGPVGPDAMLILRAIQVLVDVLGSTSAATLASAEAAYWAGEAEDNYFAMWLAAGVVASVALELRDAQLGRTWSRRVIDAQSRLGADAITYQVETFGDFLGLEGFAREAVRIFAATHHSARRTGAPWPRNPLTLDLLDRCRTMLAPEDFERAWGEGPSLSRHELTREPAALLAEPATGLSAESATKLSWAP